ncbi:MAG: hypothetical protein WEF50_05655 [Myxococcota bacterium]
MRKLLLLIALLSTVSCATLGKVGKQVTSLYPGGDSALTLDELRAGLLDFSSLFGMLVTDAADRISAATSEAKIRRLALLWKIRMPPAAQLAATDPNPRTGYVEMLTVAVSQRQFFEDGAGSAIFGEQQHVALEAAKEIEAAALHGGSRFLPESKLKELHLDVQQLAKEHPIRGEFLRQNIQAGLEKAEKGGAFDDIISIPMAPFRAIAGVESGAQAIHEFNATAAQFTEIIDQLPQRTRWQMELLSYDLQEQGGVLEQSLKSFDSVARSADRLSIVAENAPEDMRQTIVAISEELELRSATLKALLEEYRAAIADTGKTASDLAPLVDGLAKTSEQLNQAGVAWNDVIAQLNAPSPPLPPGTAPPRPFDILDYERTAVAIRSTTEEIRGALSEVKAIEDGPGSAFADRLLRNGLILIAVFFAGLLGYRWIASRIAPSR